MKLHLGLGTLHRLALSAAKRRQARILCDEPIVSFTFDDFPRSALDAGGRLLEEHGAHGTYYVSPALLNASNHLGELFHVEDLHSLLLRGHELGSHTFGHVSAKTLSPEDFWKNVEKGKEAIRTLTGVSPEDFAYPFGALTPRIKQHTHGVKSARSVIPGLNKRIFDLNLLRANSLYGDVDTVSHAVQMIANNVRNRAWLIFYTHDVRQMPSPYGCTPALLDMVMQEALRSQSRLLSVQEALALCEELPAG
jgi:peptidoglycan/xylan/chitin deacetylase (PgdA/CDA1 family)